MFRYGCNTRHHDRGDAPVMRPPVITNQKRSLPPATAGKSLLDEYSPRDSVAGEANTWQLPMKTKRLLVGLLIAAAHDDIESLDAFLTPDARWGDPDYRQLNSRPVYDHGDPRAFFDALRDVTAKIPASTQPEVTPWPPSANFFVRYGAEPFWTGYVSPSGVMIVRLTMRDGVARVDYVGLSSRSRSEAEQLAMKSDKEPKPPLVPRLKRPPISEMMRPPPRIMPVPSPTGAPTGSTTAPPGPTPSVPPKAPGGCPRPRPPSRRPRPRPPTRPAERRIARLDR